MKKISERKLKKVLKSIKPIEIEFNEFDWNEMSYKNDSFEMYEDDVFIMLNLEIISTYTTTGDNITEPCEHNIEESQIFLSVKTVMIDEDEFTLDYKQLRRLEKEIISNLEY